MPKIIQIKWNWYISKQTKWGDFGTTLFFGISTLTAVFRDAVMTFGCWDCDDRLLTVDASRGHRPITCRRRRRRPRHHLVDRRHRRRYFSYVVAAILIAPAISQPGKSISPDTSFPLLPFARFPLPRPSTSLPSLADWVSGERASSAPQRVAPATSNFGTFLPLCISAAYAVMRCLSVCPSVRQVRRFCRNK